MQISSKEILVLISIITVIFLTIPLFLIAYIRLYNERKNKHAEEKRNLKSAFENELLKSQIEVQEQTLKTIAYDLHDNIGQILGLTVITLSSIDLENREKAAEKISTAEELTKRSIKAIRSISRLLHGEELLSRGLTGAIAFELEWLEKSDLFTITYLNNAKDLKAQPEKETIIFRLFQEILNNILKHAQATQIAISLELSNNVLTLSLEDNGIGFEVNQQYEGMGLQNIQKRAAMINGNALFSSKPGSGTKIVITIPY